MNIDLGINRTNKKAVCSLSLILLLAMTIMMAFAQPTLGQVGIPQPRTTTGYISVAPLLLGVGQKATVNLWVFPTPEEYAQLPAFQGFSGVTVTFTKPDGTKDTFMPVDGTGQYVAGQTESIGDIFFFYAPDMAGNWSVSFTMPAQNITDSSGTVQFVACTSSSAYFTVQTDPVNAGLLNGYPWSELPKSNVYWSYPINSNNREWNAISGDWTLYAYTKFSTIAGVTSNSWQPYGSAVNSAHIVWDQSLGAGGIVGGEYGSISYEPAFGFGQGAIVVDGKAFANLLNANEFECIDLTTGKVLYTMPGQISGAIHEPGNAFMQNRNNGVVLANTVGSMPTPYLFGSSSNTYGVAGSSSWNFYDPSTGTLVQSIYNATASPLTGGCKLVDGTTLAYGITNGQVFAWNMSRVVNSNWPTGITWTKPTWLSPSATILGVSTDQSTIVVTGYSTGTNQFGAYSTKDGTSLWNLTIPYTVGLAFTLYGVNDFMAFNGVDATFHCYSMLTGAALWASPSFSSSPWTSEYDLYCSETNDNNNYYVMFPDGTMAALSLTTGQMVWHNFVSINSTEYINNVVPYYIGLVMEGGNIYAYAGYSLAYELDPVPRQAMTVCVNATTGSVSWTLNGGVTPKAAADGYILGLGAYDGNLYCIGKGQTLTTVSAPQTSITAGTTVEITGSVLDQSAAQQNTAAISDANMSEWMDYLHMQNSTLLNNPPQCTGVPVTLTAVDPNGNTVTIGTTTSNYQGNYGFQWTPTISGQYTIYATFAGSNSYYTSSASTYATVASASLSSPVPTSGTEATISNSDMLTYLALSVVAIIIAIAVVGALILRKK